MTGIRTLFEEKEEDYYKLVIFIAIVILNDKNKTLSIKKYLDELRPYLKDVKSNLKKLDTWKTQLTMAVTFISSKKIK